jgi:hypothetical protein
LSSSTASQHKNYQNSVRKQSTQQEDHPQHPPGLLPQQLIVGANIDDAGQHAAGIEAAS